MKPRAYAIKPSRQCRFNAYEDAMKDCNSCGKYCTKYNNGGLSATESEIAFWDICRPEIARYVDDGKIWMSPDNGQQLELFPG